MSKVNTYELTNPPHLKEEIVVEYTDGRLSAVILPVKCPLSRTSFYKLLSGLQYHEQDIMMYKTINLTPVKETPKNEKLAMFCEKYMEYHNNEKYKASGNDANVLRPYKVTYEILDAYYRSKHFNIVGAEGVPKHGVFNFVKNYNLVLDEMRNPVASRFPNYYSKEFADKMRVEDLPQYWKHLTALGLEPKKNNVGALMDWVKKVS